MAAPRLYTHEKHLKRLENQKGFTLHDIEDEDIVKSVEIFNTYKAKVKGFHPQLEKSSLKISSAIKRYLDSDYDEEEEIIEPIKVEHPKIEEEVILPEALIIQMKPIEESIPIIIQGRIEKQDRSPIKLGKNELVLARLYAKGKRENITKEDLQKAGFDCGFFTCPLTPTGYKGKAYELLKKKSESEYQLHKL